MCRLIFLDPLAGGFYNFFLAIDPQCLVITNIMRMLVCFVVENPTLVGRAGLCAVPLLFLMYNSYFNVLYFLLLSYYRGQLCPFNKGKQ